MDIRTPDAVDLEQLLYILAALGEMAEQMTTNPNPQTSIRAILRMAKGAFGMASGELFLFEGAERRLVQLTEALDETPAVLVVPQEARHYFLSEGGAPILALEPAPGGLAVFLEANAEALAGLPGHIWLPLSVNRHFLGLLLLGPRLTRAPLGRTELDILTLIGRQLAVALHNLDLTAHLKRANLQLGLKVRQLEQLYDISRDLSSTLDRGRITRELMVRAIELMDARKGVLLTAADESAGLEVAALFGFAELPLPPSWLAEDGWLAPVLHEGRTLVLAGGLPSSLAASSCVAVPVVYQERIFGVLAVFDKEERAHVGVFGDEDVPMLENLASQAATAIENARLYELATVDGLTKLYIRRHFLQRLDEELRRAQRYDTRLSLMMIDIDHFKHFNDTYGHALGDEVLRVVARTLRASVRENLDIPARLGGEELVVLMPETDPQGAYALAERVREAIAAAPLPGPGGQALSVSVSVGVATYPLHALDRAQLLEAADKALYRSKGAGRNRTSLAE